MSQQVRLKGKLAKGYLAKRISNLREPKPSGDIDDICQIDSLTTSSSTITPPTLLTTRTNTTSNV